MAAIGHHTCFYPKKNSELLNTGNKGSLVTISEQPIVSERTLLNSGGIEIVRHILARCVKLTGVKAGLQYQSFCHHSRNFAWVNPKFSIICKKSLRKLNR